MTTRLSPLCLLLACSEDVRDPQVVDFPVLGALQQSAIESWTAEGDQTGAFLGYRVAIDGDVNGDGFADVVAAATYGTDALRAYHGSASGPELVPSWVLQRVDVETFGYLAAYAGDVNGDGYDDVLVGGIDTSDPPEVHMGSATGLTTPAAWVGEDPMVIPDCGSSAGDVNGDGYDDLILGDGVDGTGEVPLFTGEARVYHGSSAGLTGDGTSWDWRATGTQEEGAFGKAVAAAGDVNADGYDDVIVGDPDQYGGEPDDGNAYIYLGSADGLENVAFWSGQSDVAGSEFGRAVSSAGDVNADGFDDVIVGAPFSGLGYQVGSAYVFFGSATMSAVPDWTLRPQVEGYFGWSVSAAGDLNADAYGDIIVGGFGYTHGELEEGGAYVFFGSPTGFGADPDFTLESDQKFASFGYAVAGGGDADGDGHDDLIVGATQYDNGEDREGRVYFYPGPCGLLAVDVDADAIPDACDACLPGALDTDGDGVCDGEDVCGAGDDLQDADADGVPDACDACPADALDDTDLDGTCDSADVCPGGADDEDRDTDGVPDHCDLCPALAGPDPDGCGSQPPPSEIMQSSDPGSCDGCSHGSQQRSVGLLIALVLFVRRRGLMSSLD